MIDKLGYRKGVAMVLFNREGKLFWAKRVGQKAWQFPQGGIDGDEAAEEAMFRELYEEVGLTPKDVKIISVTKGWLKYDLPEKLRRYHQKPLCIGQKQKWYLLRYEADESAVNFNVTKKPEFDGWKWVDYWSPLDGVIDFKSKVYTRALKIFAPYVLKGKKLPR